jgi:ABC-type phosphate transport system substrate-binding protein
MTRRPLTTWLVLAACVAAKAAAAGDVIVIVNNDNPNPVDRAFVQRVYSGALRGWPDGNVVVALDQPEESVLRERFSVDVLGRSPAHMRALWSQNIFTGKGLPPKVAVADAEMKRYVAADRHAIGYISASQLDASVKAVGP